MNATLHDLYSGAGKHYIGDLVIGDRAYVDWRSACVKDNQLYIPKFVEVEDKDFTRLNIKATVQIAPHGQVLANIVNKDGNTLTPIEKYQTILHIYTSPSCEFYERVFLHVGEAISFFKVKSINGHDNAAEFLNAVDAASPAGSEASDSGAKR